MGKKEALERAVSAHNELQHDFSRQLQARASRRARSLSPFVVAPLASCALRSPRVLSGLAVRTAPCEAQIQDELRAVTLRLQQQNLDLMRLRQCQRQELQRNEKEKQQSAHAIAAPSSAVRHALRVDGGRTRPSPSSVAVIRCHRHRRQKRAIDRLTCPHDLACRV